MTSIAIYREFLPHVGFVFRLVIGRISNFKQRRFIAVPEASGVKFETSQDEVDRARKSLLSLFHLEAANNIKTQNMVLQYH